MPTEYEDESENKEEGTNFFDNLDDLRLSLPEPTPAEEAEWRGRVRCAWNMSAVRKAELEAVVEKWLDRFIADYKDAVIPRNKAKMLELLTTVVLPACRLFGLLDDADLEQEVTPDDKAVELLINLVDDYLYSDEDNSA